MDQVQIHKDGLPVGSVLGFVIFDLTDQAADTAEQGALGSAAASPTDRAAVSFVLPGSKSDSNGGRVLRYVDLAVPSEVVIGDAGSAIDLKRPAFIVNSEEILAIDGQEPSQDDLLLLG